MIITFDLVSIGEILIDLTQTGVNELGVPQFSANPGGAPANVAVAASRLGVNTYFIGKVGCDGFGRFLKDTLTTNNINISGLKETEQTQTTVAVVTVDSTGERSFSFYRNQTADIMLVPSEVQVPDTKILHFGSVSLTTEPSRSSTLEAINQAINHGAIVSYDPNYRPNLWSEQTHAVSVMKSVLRYVNVLKVSDEEMLLLTGTSNLEEGSRILAKQGISLILVTLGANGSFYRYGESTGHVNGFTVNVADTNGAGDTFFGAILYQLTQKYDLKSLTENELVTMLTFANKAASITTSRDGAIPAMPYLTEL